MDAKLSGDVDLQLTRFIRRSRVRGMRMAAEIDPNLDYTGYLLLHAIIEARDGVRGTELAESFGVHKSTISRSITNLEKLGLTERVPDPNDGRAQLLTPTAESRAKIAAIQERSHIWLADIIDDWPAEEHNAFAASLARLNEAAEQNPIR